MRSSGYLRTLQKFTWTTLHTLFTSRLQASMLPMGFQGSLYTCMGVHEAMNFQTSLDPWPKDIGRKLGAMCTRDRQLPATVCRFTPCAHKEPLQAPCKWCDSSCRAVAPPIRKHPRHLGGELPSPYGGSCRKSVLFHLEDGAGSALCRCEQCANKFHTCRVPLPSQDELLCNASQGLMAMGSCQ